MASRVAYFLIQGVGLSFIMRPQSSGSGDKEAAATKANSQPLQPAVIISAIVDALLKSQGEYNASDKFPSSSSSTTISSTESKPILSERSVDEQVEFLSQNFAGIIKQADGVVILRNELMLELEAEKLVLAQKWMTQTANLASIPVFLQS
jgi:hypothetical protein